MNKILYGYVEAKAEGLSGSVLEVGSRDVNGTVRPIFSNRERFPAYVGVDIEAGPGVDRIADSSELPFSDSEFSVAISTSVIEHDPRFWVSLAEIFRVLKSGGTLILTSCGIEYPRHNHPDDYYRFTDSGIRAAMQGAGFEVVEAREIGKYTVGMGRKP